MYPRRSLVAHVATLCNALGEECNIFHTILLYREERKDEMKDKGYVP